MRRLLALAALVCALPTANAQDKGKADFSHNAEYRARYWWMQNPGGEESTNGKNSYVDQRFKLHTAYRASEKFSAAVTLFHNSSFGRVPSEVIGQHNDMDSAEHFLTVNEAYANWMMSEDLNFRIGRQGYVIADGYVIGANDWEPLPLALEGLLANYEVEFGKFQAFAFKFRDGVTTGTAPDSSASRDPEHNAYGVNFDLKTMPEWLKGLNVHVIQNVADAMIGGAGSNIQGTQGQDVFRYGLTANGEFGNLDAKVWYAAHTGKHKEVAANGTKTEFDADGNMMQAEVGFKMPKMMNSRFFVQYHQDSGDKDDNDPTAANRDGKHETYDSYLYQMHQNAGLMDLFGWGNLTYITLGWNGKLNDRTHLGAMFTMFSKTEAGVNSTQVAGTMGTGLVDNSLLYGTSDELGNELDVWAEHRYDGGLSTVARLGYFQIGDAFSGASGLNKRDDNILQIMIEGKLTF